MDAKLELIGNAVQVRLPVEQGNGVHVIVGGADGILITIDSHGRIHVRPPEGPGPTEDVRAAVAAIRENVQVLSKAAQVELNPQPIPPGRSER
jgi:hypothetical protein